ncbi:MAG: bifunctional adenosylcobinamide kinase/adenosylcobinamide-phosphate guanylyltransferase, partial [Coriobacteriia bacterium]|nr:bifunctional adenosylcobinamide kinase/adenosylcobinamide-phosphate guanylyltransferase [Coriobacteriia bacterium]
VGEDREMAARIARHKADRPAGFVTIEALDSVEWTARVSDGVMLLDCLGTLLGLVMAETYAETAGSAMQDADVMPEGYEEEVERRFAGLIGWILRRWDHMVVVTNEVGDGIVPAFASGRVFRDVLGRANRSLIDRSDAAYLVVAGRCIELSDLPQRARWPRPKGCE